MTERRFSRKLVEHVRSGNVEAVRRLLREGAKPNHCDESGTPVLNIAAGRGRPDLVKAFIEHKANVNLRGLGNKTALHAAAESGSVETAKMLVEAGAKTNERTDEGLSPLDVAHWRRHKALEDYLASLMKKSKS